MTAPLAEYTGTLLHRAEARTARLDHDGTAVPVLCLDIELDNPLHTHLHAEQTFPVGHHAQAHAAAHRLVKGTRVTVQAPLVGLRLVAANASHIHPLDPIDPLTPTTETPEPCQQSRLL